MKTKKILFRPLRLSAVPFVLIYFGISSIAWAQTNSTAFTIVYRYDNASRLIGMIRPDPDGVGAIKYAAVRNTYNSQGLVARVETGELASWMNEAVLPSAWTNFTIQQTLDITYDSVGRKLTEQNSAAGIAFTATQYSYDSAGRLECTAQRMNPDVFGSLPASACVLAAQGSYEPDRITKKTYDANFPTLVSVVQQGVGTSDQVNYVAYSYNINRLQEAAIDANGNKSYFVYDGLGRLQYLYFPSKTTVGQYSVSDYEQYSYDSNGNRTTLRKRDGQAISYTYDGLNRLASEVHPAGTIPNVYYGYDLRNLQLFARFNSVSGSGLTYTFDGFGRQLSASTNLSGQTRTLTYQYDADGNRTRITHPDGSYFVYGFDGLNRLNSIGENGASTSVISVEYNSQGRRSLLGRGSAVASSGVTKTSYSYDGITRLQTLTQDFVGTAYDETRGFTYNRASQVASRTLNNAVYSFTETPIVTTTYTANGLNQYVQLASSAVVSPTHDANGNMIFDGSTVFGYDVLNRLTNVSGSKTVNLTYDPKGRLFQTVGSVSGTNQYLYDGDSLVAEYDGAGNMLRRYVHGSGVDEPLVWYEGAGVNTASRRYQHVDHLGSVTAVADTNGNGLATNTYDAYGVPATTNSGRFQYTGQIVLPDLAGLYHYKARMYHAGLGRFLQSDPIGYKDDMNLYGYVGNDPMNRTDTTGTYSCGASLSTSQCDQAMADQSAAIAKLGAGIAAVQGIKNTVDSGGKLSADQKEFAKGIDNVLGAGASTNSAILGSLVNAGNHAMQDLKGSTPLETGVSDGNLAVHRGSSVTLTAVYFKSNDSTRAGTLVHEGMHRRGEGYVRDINVEGMPTRDRLARAQYIARNSVSGGLADADTIALTLLRGY